jgi:hypothetical protein
VASGAYRRLEIVADLTIDADGTAIQISSAPGHSEVRIQTDVDGASRLDRRLVRHLQRPLERLIAESGQAVTVSVNDLAVVQLSPRRNLLGWVVGTRLGVHPVSWRAAWSLYRGIS